MSHLERGPYCVVVYQGDRVSLVEVETASGYAAAVAASAVVTGRPRTSRILCTGTNELWCSVTYRVGDLATLHVLDPQEYSRMGAYQFVLDRLNDRRLAAGKNPPKSSD